MKPSDLFMRRYEEAVIYTESHGEVDLLDLVRVIYQLIMDKNSLLNAVKASDRVVFTVQESSFNDPLFQEILKLDSFG